MKTRRFLRFALSTLCLAAGLFALRSHAAVTWWDPEGNWGTYRTYTGAISFTGNWEASSWSTSDKGQTTTVAWIEGNAAGFAVGAGATNSGSSATTVTFTITANSNHTLAGIFDGALNPDSCIVTINGPGQFTLPAGQDAFDLLNSSDSSLGQVIINNALTGPGQLLSEGNGQLFLNGANSYSGGTAIGAFGTTMTGLINFNNAASFGIGPIQYIKGTASSFGALVAEGAAAITLPNAVDWSSAVSNNPSLNIVGNAAGVTLNGNWNLGAKEVHVGSGGSGNLITIGGVISGSGSLTKFNNSTLALTAVNTYTGPTTNSAGTLTISGAGSLNSGNYAGVIANNFSGAVFNWSSSASQTFGGQFVGASGTFNVNGPGTLTLSGSADNTSLGANINNGGVLVLAKTSTSGVHALGSTTTVNSGGTLRLSGGGGDQIFSGVNVTVNSGGVFDANGFSESMTSLTLNGNGISSGGALMNNTAGFSTITGTAANGFPLGSDASVGGSGTLTMSGVISGAHALTKVGTGTLTLNSANTYSGLTKVNAGTLALGVNSALPIATTVNLAGGTLNMSSFSSTVTALQFSGIVKAKGSWGSLTSTATHKDAQFSGTGLLTVNTGGSSTLSFSAIPNPADVGVSVTLSATVVGTGGNGSTPTGTVSFYDGVTLLGTQPVSGSGTTVTASLVTSFSTVGSHSLLASYSGDSNYDFSSGSGSENVNPALTVTCPADISAAATSASGAPVNYSDTVSGGCGAPSGSCNPPSGSTFPIGTTLVICTAMDTCGGSNGCSFHVTVTNPVVKAPEYFSTQNLLPPTNSVYISPAQWHALYAQGIVIRDVRHRFFTQSYPLPPIGTTQPETFNSELDFQVSFDNGATFQPGSGTATVSVNVTHSSDINGTSFFNTEMTQLDLSGPGFMLRESPTLQSTGQTTVRPVAGGFMISSFFDVFTEISTDGGTTWQPAQQSGHMELRDDPLQAPTVAEPTPLLPPPNDKYISPAQWHALYAQGIVIKDVSHKLFTTSLLPPSGTATNNEVLNSQIDLNISTDGGNSFQSVRVPAPVTISVAGTGSGTSGMYDTEMTSLNLSGLPGGIMVRNSQTEHSRGSTQVTQQSDGTYQINSFFDIFTELSTDGGASWQPATNGPVHMHLTQQAPETPQQAPVLPPQAGSYVSPAQWHALYANGIIITNASHNRFTQTQPLPVPGGNTTESFGSQVGGLISMDGGASFNPFSAPANVSVQVNSRSDLDNNNTRYFDTEMLQLDLSGGTLPGGVMVRESPSKASLGRTSVRTDASGYHVSSFFDIFTEVSLDGGATWTPQLTQPGTMGLKTNGPNPIVVNCSTDITVAATAPSGAVVYFTSTASGGCNPPITPNCNPPSGSTFPVGTSTVTCTATDGCGNSGSCSFHVTVTPPPTVQAPEYFTPYNLLPPPGTVYISPALWHTLYAQGIVIRDVRHRFFTANQPPPPLGVSQTHVFSSEVDYEVSFDNGATFQPGSGTANVQVQVTHSQDANGTSFYNTEMLQLDLNGGGFMLRESPTLQSTGQTTIRPVAGGYMVSSFFDIFTEVSTDGGASWQPAQQTGHMELRNDPANAPAVPHPTPLLPPPGGGYVSPQQWHALFAQGIVIKDVSHKFFTQSYLPPSAGITNTHAFNSILDMSVSLDGGASFQSVRANSAVTVSVAGVGSGASGLYDTEMTQLDATIQLNGLTLMIRESPTLPSRGGTLSTVQGDGTFQINSFFDIFTEISLDNGQTWSAPTNGPVRMHLTPIAPEVPKASPNLPPLDGTYISPAKWHALYQNGIIITNASHNRFTQNYPPPAPGGSQTENFGSQVSGLISMDGGASFQPFSAPASVAVQVNSRSDQDNSNTRYFDSEMLALNLSGGTLPGGVMVRESPSKASLGRTSVRTDSQNGYHIDSLFDIFTEVSLDGGNTWTPSVTAPGTMALKTNPPPINVTCSADITVTTPNSAGAVVNFASSATGGCSPPSVVCNPPSGSTFPVGTTTVTCTASDICGNSASCSFHVTVKLIPEYFTPYNLLPPPGTVYISPALWHVLYNNGIVIRDVRHRFFTANLPPPPLGTSQTHVFNSEVDYEVSFDNGATFAPASGTANVQVHVTHSQDANGFSYYNTEMLQLDLTGNGFMLRESPTLQSTGQTTIRPVAGGYMVSSFFDIFTEVSTDGGASWQPAQQSGHMELRNDPATAPAVPHPTPILPPPGGGYVSPQQWHALFAQGIVIRNASHKFFTSSLQPPAAGATNNESFNSQVDLDISTDGGNSFQTVRVPAPVQITVVGVGSGASGYYDTEMTSLNLNGLPGGIMIRESPTLPSRGGTLSQVQSDGTYQINSFFDIFVELSTDGGATWQPATNGPVRMELTPIAPEVPKPNPNLPPLDGNYVSPARWHALYANGIIITNASHNRFTQTYPPPPPGGGQTENFGSTVSGLISMNGGASFQPFSAPASVQVQVNSRSDEDNGATRYFDTEMLSLNLSGGNLPGGVMVRESPSKASLGRTSVRTDSSNNYHVSSFFDIFTEVSLDGGNTWSPTITAPGTMGLRTNPPTPVSVTCSSNINVAATSPAGAVVTYYSTASGGCSPPPALVCNPPSGSTFPVGTTTVTCQASDNCGGSAMCSFTVTVTNTPFVLTCSSNITTGATSCSGATVYYNSTVSGGCDPTPSVLCNPPSGSTFPIGTTTVTCQASDSCGGTTMCSFTVTVTNYPIQLTCSSNIATFATSCGGATVYFTSTANGGCSGSPSLNCSPASGSIFPVGTTPVSCTATDAAGQMVTCGFSVTVTNRPILLTCSSNITTGATSCNGATVYFTSTAFGGCDGTPTLNCSPGSGSIFPIGTSMVTCTANDSCCQTQYCSFSVTVTSCPPVVVNCSTNITVTTSSCTNNSAVVFYTSSASGGCGTPFLSCNPPSGSSFPLGTTPVSCTATDACGNHATCSFMVTVSKPTCAPVIVTCSSNITVNPTGCSGATVFYTSTASGGCSPVSLVCNPPSGSTFPIGTTPVTCTATDPCGNSQTCGFSVTVSPCPAIVLTCSTNITVTNTSCSSQSAVVFYTSSATGGCSNVTVVCSPPSGSSFPLGTTTVFCSASDGCGHSANCSFTVTVRPPTCPPLIVTCSTNITTSTSSSAGAVVFFTSSSTGGCAPVNLVCSPPSGSTFPPGSTTVTCTASDSCTNSSTCFFTVTVVRNVFVITNTLPPTNTVYVSPALYHALYAQGIIIRDIRHRFFTQSQPPPPLGSSQTETFNSEIDCEVSTDNGTSYHPVTGTAQVTVQVTHSQDTGGASVFNTEMTALNMTAGGIMLRESPTLQSTGQTTIRPTSGGYMVSSFFDIFTEVSVDGGNTWLPSQGPAHVEMHNDPRAVPPVSFGTPALPPPNGQYVSPQQWHALYAQGIIISNVSHRIFGVSFAPPPSAGQTQTESFNSILDMMVSTDGGHTFHYVRAQGPVGVTVSSLGSGASGMYDTEMTSLNLTTQVGTTALMLRVSQTTGTRGEVQQDAQSDGTYRISSFFDVFTELSLDGGNTWNPPTNGPVRMQLTPIAPEVPSSSNFLPMTNAPYVSPAQWHAAYANGIYISNVTHRGFTQNYPPPPAGQGATEIFNSILDLQISLDGGKTYTSVSVPANCQVSVSNNPALGIDPTNFVYDTIMRRISPSGGLPGGMMIRASTNQPSTGRTTIRPDPTAPGNYRISSFFDIFTEISMDGGNTWLASTSPPALMTPRLPAKKRPFPQPNLPPTNSQYISPSTWHALYANGVIISNVTHKRFLANMPPPAHNSTNIHHFGSIVTFLLSMGPGQPFMPMTANADCQVSVANTGFQGSESVFQTEMTSLNLSGGSLPPGVMIRESPTRRSLGETHYAKPGSSNYRISSFFDIFTEVSLDGGNSWSAASSPGYMELHIDPGVPPTVLVSPTLNGAQFSVSLQSQLGLSYTLQYKNDIMDPTWTSLGITSGNGQTLILVDPSIQPHRFYRVQVQEDDSQAQ